MAAYVHTSIAPGLGKIGVLVGLESSGDKAKLAAEHGAKGVISDTDHYAPGKGDALCRDTLRQDTGVVLGQDQHGLCEMK